jgi:hypothetical protein
MPHTCAAVFAGDVGSISARGWPTTRLDRNHPVRSRAREAGRPVRYAKVVTSSFWRDRTNCARTHIADEFLWSKVRAIGEGPSATFGPIRRGSGQYVTHFGLSHDRDDIEPK